MKPRHLLIFTLAAGTLPGQIYTLEECVQQALQNKETLRAAALEVESAAAGRRGSRSEILPAIRFSGGWSESRFPQRNLVLDPITGRPVGGVGATITSFTSVSSGMSISQTIYDGGAWWNTIARAGNNYQLSRQRERQVIINVIREVHRTFFSYLKIRHLLEVARLNLELSQQQVDLVQHQFDLGAVKKTDLLKAEVSLGQAQVEVLNQEAALKNAYRELRNAMGVLNTGPGFEVREKTGPLPAVPLLEEARAEMAENNPSLWAKRTQIRDSEINHRLVQASRLPSLSATVGYSSSADDPEILVKEWNNSWQLRTGISISLPIFTGYDLSTRVQQARLGLAQQQNEYISQQDDLQVQLESILESLDNYREVIPINEKVLLSAEEDLKLAQERYALGATTILEVLDAQVSVIRARSTLISSQYDARIQEANLKSLMGTLDKDFD